MKAKIEGTKKNENLKAAILGIDALINHFDDPAMNRDLLSTARQIKEHVEAALQDAASEDRS